MENLAKPEVKIGDWIGEGWRMFTSQWKAWALNAGIFFAVCILPLMAVGIGFYVYILAETTRMSRTPYGTVAPEFPIAFMIAFVGVYLFTILIMPFFMGGMHRTAIKQLKGGKIEVRDLFSGGDIYFSMLGSIILGGIVTVLASLLCILPALIVPGLIFFTAPLIIDRKLGVIQAMQTSFEFTKKNWFMFALFAFIVQFLAYIGTYACYIGLLATLPLLFTITAVAYRDCFGVEGARYFLANAPPMPSDYGQQPGQPGYSQPPSAIYGQQSYEPPPPGGYNPPFGYPPPPPAEAPPQPINEFSLPPIVEPPPVADAPPQTPPQPEAQKVDPQPPQAGETLAIESLMPPSKISCPSCQASLPATAAFCPRCGNRIGK